MMHLVPLKRYLSSQHGASVHQRDRGVWGLQRGCLFRDTRCDARTYPEDPKE
jgi:hypothetical protein